jgi:hypothetical protein
MVILPRQARVKHSTSRENPKKDAFLQANRLIHDAFNDAQLKALPPEAEVRHSSDKTISRLHALPR